jgi:hypothetical protein
MNLLRKLPNSQRSPSGLEWVILKKLPMTLLACTVIPLLWYWLSSLFPANVPGESAEKYLTGVSIAVIATVITAWTAVFTVAIGCFIVILMKGPAYVADQYPLSDAETPSPSGKRRPRSDGASVSPPRQDDDPNH